MTADEFPRLRADNHSVTSPANVAYNCVAWAIGDDTRWWEPGMHWPFVAESPLNHGVDALEQLFLARGYAVCETPALEPGVEKVALYGSGIFFTHVARQLADGQWTSKLGKSEDIKHDTPDDLAGGAYGQVLKLMMRVRQVSSE